ncbi:MAG: tail fiber domain-containing protein [Opitutales bacterium]|nr:tail fiber domain-containing protein [Opitutales bacterium]
MHSTIGGGRDNEASGGRSIIGGGNSNTASASLSTIGGGTGNETSELYSTVAGGFGNTASGDRSTVAGGSINEASGSRSTVAGGLSNEAAGDFSFAAGKQSKVGEDHHGTFVWADHTQEDFESTDEDQFLIRAGGGVGIGTNAPNNQLSVDGKANFSDHVGIGRTSPETNLHLAGLNAESNNPDGLRMQDSRIREGNFWDLHLGDSSLRFGKNGDDVAYVDSTGDWNIFSDARLKTDITPVESVLSEVENLKVVNYHYKDRDHGEHPQVGFLAQDVDKLFPHLTSRENNNDYWSLNYTGFSVLAIRAIQEQQEIIETQDARLAKQEDRITELEEQLAAQDDLEARLARLENTVAGEELAASRE